MKKPIIISQGFMRLSHAAQLLFFHMSARTRSDGCISKYDASDLREKLGIGDDAVRELVRNRFISDAGEYSVRVEEYETYHDLVVEGNGEDEVSVVMFGREMWRVPISQYQEFAYGKKAERERRYGTNE